MHSVSNGVKTTPLPHGGWPPHRAVDMALSYHRPLGTSLRAEDCASPDGSHLVVHRQHGCGCSADEALKAPRDLTSLCLYKVTPFARETRRWAQHSHVPLLGYPQSVAWSPDSSSMLVYATHGEGCSYVVMTGYRSHSHGTLTAADSQPWMVGSWIMPNMSKLESLAKWSPCSTFLAMVTTKHVIIAHVQQRSVLTRVGLSSLSMQLKLGRAELEWVSVAGHVGVAAWVQTDEVSSQQAQTRVHLCAPGASGSWGCQEVPVGQLAMGHSAAGFRDGSLVLHPLLRLTGKIGPAIHTNVQHTAAGCLLAWAPNGGIWLAVVSVASGQGAEQIAHLELVDGRTGRSRYKRIVLHCAEPPLCPKTAIWSSTGRGIMLGFTAIEECGCECWFKFYIHWMAVAKAQGRAV